MAEGTGADSNSKSLEEQFKALQASLSKRDARINRMSDGLLDIGELKASQARQEYMLLHLLEADPDRKQVAEEIRGRIKTDTTSSAYSKEITKLLGDRDWNDKELMEVRSLWGAGDAPGALSALQRLNAPDPTSLTEEQIEAEVEKRITAREAQSAGAKTVDTGGSTTSGTKKQYTREDIRNLHTPTDGVLDFKKAKAAKNDFLDQFYSKR